MSTEEIQLYSKGTDISERKFFQMGGSTVDY